MANEPKSTPTGYTKALKVLENLMESDDESRALEAAKVFLEYRGSAAQGASPDPTQPVSGFIPTRVRSVPELLATWTEGGVAIEPACWVPRGSTYAVCSDNNGEMVTQRVGPGPSSQADVHRYIAVHHRVVSICMHPDDYVAYRASAVAKTTIRLYSSKPSESFKERGLPDKKPCGCANGCKSPDCKNM